MISPFEATLRGLSDASRTYQLELSSFAAATQLAAKRDAALIIRSAEHFISDTHKQLRSATVAIRRRRRARRKHARRSPTPRSPLATLPLNAAADGSRARSVHQLLQNDRLQTEGEPPVPLVAPLPDASPRRSDGGAEQLAVDPVGERSSPTSVEHSCTAQDEVATRDRRSTATVESYETANADVLTARVVPDTASSQSDSPASSPAPPSPPQPRVHNVVQSTPSTDHQPNHHPHDVQHQSLPLDTRANTPHEQSPSHNVQPEHEPQEQQQPHRSPLQQHAPKTSQTSASEAAEPQKPQSNHSRSSPDTAFPFESHVPADIPADQSHVQQQQPHSVPHSPPPDSGAEREASFSTQQQNDAKLSTPQVGSDELTAGSSSESETHSDDGPPAGIQQSPLPAVNLQVQQTAAITRPVKVDKAESSDNERDEPKEESSCERGRPSADFASRESQQMAGQQFQSAPIQTHEEGLDGNAAKVAKSKETSPVVEAEAIIREAEQPFTERNPSGDLEMSPGEENESSVPNSAPAPEQVRPSRIPRKPSRIVVDNSGKIDNSSLNALSRIMNTKPVDNTDTQIRKSTQKFTTPRTTKLFKPNNNIYSLQQNGNVSPVQQFSSSNRSSVLSHTPGAEAPFKRQSPVVSRQHKLESLNKQLESFQSSKTTGLQGPELQMAELRNGRTGAHVLGDLANSNVSQVMREGENVFRSMRERTLKLAETHVKDTSKVDIWSMRAKGAKTTPSREKLRARERSKSKSAFRSQLKEIMTGKACSAEDDVQAENGCNSSGSRLLESSGHRDSMVEPAVSDSGEESVSINRFKDGETSSFAMESKEVAASPQNAQSSAVEKSSFRSETHDACSGANDSETGKDFGSGPAVASFSNTKMEEQNDVNAEVLDIERVPVANAPLTNLMTSLVSFLPGTSSLLGARPTREQSEETEAEAAAKRQKLDIERREAEVQARREAQRLLKQKETEEKQRRAEKRRLLLARAEKEKEEERRRKEERRLKKKLEEEEARKKKKQEDDRKKEERRRLVLEKRAQNEMKLKRKKKGIEPLPSRKVPKGISGKSGIASQGASHSPDTGLPGYKKRKLSGTPSTPVTKKSDTCHGQSNYDMTPAQETVFELSDEEEERRKHKQIPQWAQGPTLSTAARAQPDPDNVFVNVPTCDLREVFGNVRRFRPRSSSANWARDRVTAQEMVKFRRGQTAFNEHPK